MTPEQFDQVYFEVAQALGATTEPSLVRDRLILLLLQRLSLDDALAVIAEAVSAPVVSDLKRPREDGDIVALPHT